MSDLYQLKSSEIPSIRNEILEKQGGKCALCDTTITDETGYSLDHQHKLKSAENGVDGNGLVRGVCCRSCNVWEGKIWNNSGRYRQPESVQDRIDMLERLILYYKTDNYPYIHPSEKVPEKKLSKRNYNRLKKVYDLKRKFPEFPKSGKLTKNLEELFTKYTIEPYN